MYKDEDSTALVAIEDGARQWIHLGGGENIEVNSLVNCKAVKIFVVLRDMTMRVEVYYSSESKFWIP